MKKLHFLLLVCVLPVLLLGCSLGAATVETAVPVTEVTAQTQPAATEPAIRYPSALEAYEAVWAGNAVFTDLLSDTQLDIRDLEHLYNPVPLSVTVFGFSMVDLDRDGTEELILRVNQEYPEHTLYYTPIILRYEAGSLYAQALAYEDLQNVKTDGTFRFWYPDRGDLGYAAMEFTDGLWQRREFALAAAGDNGESVYYVDGESVARGLFRSAELEQNGKADVIEYSDWNRYLQEAQSEPVLPAEPDTALAAYDAVFRGEKDIFRSASQEWIPLNKLSLFFTVEEFPWTIAQIAVLDLDGDGTPEVVAEVSDYAGYLLLRCQENGTVTGQEIWYRAFQDLKADGSYRGSGSSFNRSYWKSRQGGDILLAECYEDENGQASYWVNGREADEAEFMAFEELQNQKPDAAWYPSWEAFLSTE